MRAINGPSNLRDPSGKLPGRRQEPTAQLPIAMRGITKSFGGHLANEGVDLEFCSGEIHALLGENGAGKTTLMNILSGLLRPDAGSVCIGEETVEFHSPRDALAYGIGMVHQHSVLVPNLTIAENVVLGHEPSWNLSLRIHEVEQWVAEQAKSLGMPMDPTTPVGKLAVDEVQQAEILRLLLKDANTLILDEPTAVLAPQQVGRLFQVLRRLRERGCRVVIITHKLDEVLELADRATVLRGGRVVDRAEPGEFDHDSLMAALVGTSPTPIARRNAPRSAVTGDVVYGVEALKVDGDRHQGACDGISFSIRSGEILGIAGVEGNGQLEMIEALAGLRPLVSGEVRIGSRILRTITPGLLDSLRVGVVSGDRHRWDMLAELSATENVLLSTIMEGQGGFSRWGLLRHRKMRASAEERLERFSVNPADPDRLVGTFSGGNQQRVVLARELSRDPLVLIAAYPSRGLDVAATRFVHETLLALREAGTAVLLLSADLDELITLSDRLGVLYRGRMAYLASTGEAEIAEVTRAMVGHKRNATVRDEEGSA